MSVRISDLAMKFAIAVHCTQKRKYTGAPYYIHLAEVAGFVSLASDFPEQGVSLDTMLAVAWLHDCIEDQGVEVSVLEQRFGKQVASGVFLLSDLEKGSRATRKALSCQRLAAAPGWVQTIKCCDIISNAASIQQLDPDFAPGYLAEKRHQLEVLTRADGMLLDIAKGIVQ